MILFRDSPTRHSGHVKAGRWERRCRQHHALAGAVRKPTACSESDDAPLLEILYPHMTISVEGFSGLAGFLLFI